jgi:monofunctional biosynthetic peptidoglycan transglycosylase
MSLSTLMSLRTLTRIALLAAAAVTALSAAALAVGTASPVLVAGGCAALLLAAPAVPVAALRWMRPPTSAMMLRTRRRLAARSDGRPTLAYTWVDLDRVSRAMWLAAIAAEDAYFRDHSGFDWDSIRDARVHNRTHVRKRGASTITQQVAKNLFLWPQRSYVRKALEAYLTGLIEALWPKRRILEVYLNIAQFGVDVFGVEAAAWRYFGGAASGLTDVQAALLAAVLPSPRTHDVGRPSHQLRFRQAWIRAAARRLGDRYLERL